MKSFVSVIVIIIFSYQASPGYSQINTDRVLANAKNAIFNDDYALGIQYLNKVIAAKPYLADPYFFRGYAKFKLEDFIGAIKDINISVDINPFQSEFLRFQGYIYNYIGEPDKALEAFNNGIKIDEYNALLYIGRASVYKEKEEYEKSLADYNKAIKQDSKLLSVYLERGFCKVSLGDSVGALADYSHVIKRNPLMFESYWFRGVLHSQLSQYQLAMKDINIVIDNFPKYAPAYFYRSYLKDMMNDKDGAALDYTTGYKLKMDKQKEVEEKQRNDDQQLADGQNKNDKDIDENNLSKKKGTRSKSDKNIKNHNKIAVLDDFEDVEVKKDDILESIRGEIQNYNIFVDLEPMFGVTYYSADSLLIKIDYYDKDLEFENNKQIVNRELKLANKEIDADQNNSLLIFNQINKLSVEIDRHEEGYFDYLFARSVLYTTVMNYSSSIVDLDELIEAEPANKLALLNRAYVRYKMVELMQSIEEEEVLPSDLSINGQTTESSTLKQERLSQQIMDYEMIINDLNRILGIDPKFEFAYYNRGIIRCLKKDFEGGIDDFTKAIELNPNFNEAYYNRGLTRIYLEQDKEGTNDLSKAGELGNFKAYSVIKRFGTIKSE